MFSCSEVVWQPRVAAAAALKDTGATLEGAEGMHAETVRRLLPSPESSSSTPGNWTCLLGLVVCAGCGEGWGPAKWR